MNPVWSYAILLEDSRNSVMSQEDTACFTEAKQMLRTQVHKSYKWQMTLGSSTRLHSYTVFCSHSSRVQEWACDFEGQGFLAVWSTTVLLPCSVAVLAVNELSLFQFLIVLKSSGKSQKQNW